MFRKTNILNEVEEKRTSPRLLKIATLLFFCSFFIIGLLIFRDYGTFYDENPDILIGLVNAKYILENLAPWILAKLPGLQAVPDLETFPDRTYGILFQVPATVLPHLFNYTTTREVYYFRHLLSFLYFFSGVTAFYLVLAQRFGKTWWPLVGTFFLVLSPRIFADSFYNGKDIVFLSFVVISWYSLNKFRQNFSLKWVILHALTSAIAFNTRIMGLIMPGLTALWGLHQWFYSTSRTFRLRIIKGLLLYGVIFSIFAVLLWPHLWFNTWESLLEVFYKLNRGGKTFEVFYFGKYYSYDQLPWHYAPVWILISTPLIYTFWFIVGNLVILKRLYKGRMHYLHSETGQQDSTAAILFFLPLLTIIFTGAILYDAWRHLFFIYPAFLYLAVVGLAQGWQWFSAKSNTHRLTALKLAIAVLTFIGVVRTAYLMIVMHPYQNVYFSFLSNQYIENNFERDYWGLSYQEGLKYILRIDNRPIIKINPLFAVGILTPAEQSRFQMVSVAEADYFLTEYRWLPMPYSNPNEIFTVKVRGMKIMSVIKMK